MIRLSAILIILFAVSCNRSDYYVSDSVTQTVETHEAKFLEIVCYCPNGVDVTVAEHQNGQIKINRESGSLRRPGGPTITEEVLEEAPSFKVEQREDTIRLITKEWLYKHRAYVSEMLRITIPQGMQYEVRNIPGDELEGRKVE